MRSDWNSLWKELSSSPVRRWVGLFLLGYCFCWAQGSFLGWSSFPSPAQQTEQRHG